jgi:hypothetical protein
VEYFELIRALSKTTVFATPEQAECDLFTTLEALGALLPAWLLHELELELPAECGQALGLGASISVGGAQRRELRGRELERVQATYPQLVAHFTPPLARHLEQELPAFVRRPARMILPPAAELGAAESEVSRLAPLPRGGLRRSGRL